MAAALTLLASPWFYLSLVLIFGAGTATGIKLEEDHRDAQLAAQQFAYQQAYAGKVQQGNVIAAALGLEKEQLADQVSDLKEQIKNAKRSDLVVASCPAAGGLSLAAGVSSGPGLKSGAPAAAGDPASPDVRFSPEFIRLYNAGIAASKSADAGGTPDAAQGAGFAYPEDVLDNAAENGTRWAECRVQLNKVIQYQAKAP